MWYFCIFGEENWHFPWKKVKKRSYITLNKKDKRGKNGKKSIFFLKEEVFDYYVSTWVHNNNVLSNWHVLFPLFMLKSLLIGEVKRARIAINYYIYLFFRFLVNFRIWKLGKLFLLFSRQLAFTEKTFDRAFLLRWKSQKRKTRTKTKGKRLVECLCCHYYFISPYLRNRTLVFKKINSSLLHYSLDDFRVSRLKSNRISYENTQWSEIYPASI